MANALKILENEPWPSKTWWKQYDRDIKKATEEFIASEKIGGNPWGFDPMTPKKEVFEKMRKIKEKRNK